MKKTVTAWVIFLIAAYILLGSCTTEEKPPKFMIYNCHQNFMKKRLRHPEEAKFATMNESKVVWINDSLFWLNSFVSSPNSFGVKIRTNYKGKYEYSFSTDMIKELQFEVIE